MPELPEVETIVRELRPAIRDRTLKRLRVLDKRIGDLRLPLPLKIISVSRHGKYIVFRTKRGKILLHLRMTGRLLLKKQQTKINEKHERTRFLFSNGLILKFLDPRRFGTIEWCCEKLPELGLNPLSRDFNAESLQKILLSRSCALKSLLLDQKLIAGLGNIYADESLWAAKLNPRRKSDSLSEKEANRLAASIKKVLGEAIKKGGFTLRDYRKTSGRAGQYQLFRKVYGREGLICFRCRGRIIKIKIGGRSAHFCSQCQS